MVLGVFRKRGDDTIENISDDLLENVPEIGGGAPVTKLTIVPDSDVSQQAHQAIDRLADAYEAMNRKLRALEEENARLTMRLKESEAKAALLDEVKASLSRVH